MVTRTQTQLDRIRDADGGWGQHMRAAREKAGISQLALSKLSGVAQASISRWEDDDMNPSLYSAVPVCDVLGIGIDEYIGRAVT